MAHLLSSITVKGVVLDLIILVILTMAFLVGWKKGLLELKLFVFIAGFALSMFLAGKLVVLCDKLFGILPSAETYVGGFLNKIFSAGIMNTTLAEAQAGTGVKAASSAQIIKLALKIFQGENISPDVTINQVVAPYVAYYALCVIAFIVLFILFLIATHIVSKHLKREHVKNTDIAKANRILGGTSTFIFTACIIYLVLAVIRVLPASWMPIDLIESSILTNLMYKFNIVVYFIRAAVGSEYIMSYIINSLKAIVP